MPKDAETNLQELKELVIQMREERNWNKHFTPKNTATSIAIEAAELLEHYQWDLLIKEDREAIASELADILIFCFHFATLYDFDIATIFKAKLEKAKQKYPAELFQDRDGLEDYHRIKKQYRKGRETK